VPACENVEDVPNIFNDASGLDPEPVDETEQDPDSADDPAVEEESLF
jgi:hypothetical protein